MSAVNTNDPLATARAKFVRQLQEHTRCNLSDCLRAAREGMYNWDMAIEWLRRHTTIK